MSVPRAANVTGAAVLLSEMAAEVVAVRVKVDSAVTAGPTGAFRWRCRCW